MTAPPAGEGWSGGWSRDRGGRGWQQSQHNNWWSRHPGPQREERNERKEKEWAGEPRLLSRDEAVIERNWLRCVACNRTFKCQYSFDQHYRDKHQSQAPQPREPWKAAKVHEVPSSAADGVTPDESISQVMFRQEQVRQEAAVAAVEGQGGPRRMSRKKADHARPMPMRGAHGPQTDGPGYMGQGYVGRVGPDTVAALASLQGGPAGPPPPPGPPTIRLLQAPRRGKKLLRTFCSRWERWSVRWTIRGQVVRPSSPKGTARAARARDPRSRQPRLPQAAGGTPARCILCTEESCDV